MKKQNLFRFGAAIAHARVARGMSQKKLALSAGVHDTRLCAMENGRVVGPGVETVGRLAAELELNPAATQRLLNAAAHDRVMLAITKNYPGDRWALLARCLDAARILGREPWEELAKLVDSLVGPLEKLEAANSSAGRPRNSSAPDQEAAMT